MKDFLGLSLNVTGNFFQVSSDHGQVFLPDGLVKHESKLGLKELQDHSEVTVSFKYHALYSCIGGK